MSQIVSPGDFPFEWFRKIKIQKRRKGNPVTKSRVKYLDIVTAFDIETTALDDIEQSIMYIWQWQFGTEYTVIGRTWEEFNKFKNRLCATCLPEGVSLVVYVHNLSYEFQFLRGIYHFELEEVFAIKSRRVLKCTMQEKRLEFRCSYIHSNMSLAEYTKKMGADHVKLSGEQDSFRSVYFLNLGMTEEKMRQTVSAVLQDAECGKIFRVKGFIRKDDKWLELNAMQDAMTVKEVEKGQEVLIVIGEELQEEKIKSYLKI